MKILGINLGGKAKRKGKLKYKVVKQGVIMSRHYTKKAAQKACKRGCVVKPLSAPNRYKKKSYKSRSRRRY